MRVPIRYGSASIASIHGAVITRFTTRDHGQAITAEDASLIEGQ
jgi:hypothetical protein